MRGMRRDRGTDMKYRKLDANDDYSFGKGKADFLANSPETVAQAVVTRLRLWRGEWFLDKTEGTPYNPSILGKHTLDSYDLAIRERILGTQGVKEILEYESHLYPETRTLTVTTTIDTIYGPASLQEVL